MIVERKYIAYMEKKQSNAIERDIFNMDEPFQPIPFKDTANGNVQSSNSEVESNSLPTVTTGTSPEPETTQGTGVTRAALRAGKEAILRKQDAERAKKNRGLVPSEQGIKSKSEILESLVEQCEPVDFREVLYPNLSEEELNTKTVKQRELKVVVIKQILQLAQNNNWALCRQNGFCYIYNGAYWETLPEDDVKQFLSDCAAKLGVKWVLAEETKFIHELYDQFITSAYFQPPTFAPNKVLINLQNGTFEVTTEQQKLRTFNHADFLTYQLPFQYDETATAPIFTKYLNRVLPDKSAQAVLAEYAGYLFIRHGSGLKFETCLILYGDGANGKSVFFEVLTALLGRENVSNFTLSELTDKTGYYRAEIPNKLLNYASEISKEMNCDMFKKLASGEPYTARLPYGRAFNVNDYAKMIFNANELPKNTEQTKAYFRRLEIIHFDVTIPEAEQDRELHRKIIDNELAGVFNWVLDGLKRLLANKKFTECESSNKILNKYRMESNSVHMFVNENNYQPSGGNRVPLNDLFTEYKSFCTGDGYKHPYGKAGFSEQLTKLGFERVRMNTGMMFCIERPNNDEPF
jgi:putative DNA primase/helicase